MSFKLFSFNTNILQIFNIVTIAIRNNSFNFFFREILKMTMRINQKGHNTFFVSEILREPSFCNLLYKSRISLFLLFFNL